MLELVWKFMSQSGWDCVGRKFHWISIARDVSLKRTFSEESVVSLG